MSGDGLNDMARIFNGDISYWSSLGYGCLGAYITMDDGLWFDGLYRFKQKHMHPVDIDGSESTDIIYLDLPAAIYGRPTMTRIVLRMERIS